MFRAPLLLTAVVATAAISGLTAQEQGAARYLEKHLSCAAFKESVRTVLRGESGAADVRSGAGREGVLLVAVRDSLGELALDAWYDSLEVWRDTESGRELPDLDGFIGGRYRGLLTPEGHYRPIRLPFVPAEVADVADLAPVLEDFLPRLPGRELRVGAQWSDSGFTIRRDRDHRAGGEARHRYAWTATSRHGDRYPAADSLEVTVDQVVREEGHLLWSPTFGPLTWSRAIFITARIPATGGVKRSLRSTIEQRIEVVRLFDPPPSCR
ncbi:MAG: hypothetical protein ACYC2K_14265 [Gemmatimonadales bacterium]